MSATHFDSLTQFMQSIAKSSTIIMGKIQDATFQAFEKQGSDLTASRILRRKMVTQVIADELGKDMAAEYSRLSEKAWTPEPKKVFGAKTSIEEA